MVQSNNKRIAKNTLLLYLRMAFMMVVQLYTSRVVLDALGIEDYGIYNVVGGVVAMFGFLNSAMTTSTQRYITYELGRGNTERLKQVFITSVNIHLFISLLVVVLSETIGLWFLLEKMIIPEPRMTAAVWVYQISIFTTVIAIMSYPYNAVIIAHERMSAFALIAVVEVVLKLVIVFMLQFGNYDKLIFYAVLIAIIQLVVRCCYSGYCSWRFEETKYRWFFEKSLFREMLAFAGWNLWGNIAAVLFSQGQNMLLNMFFGPLVNAARAVSVQVQGAIHQFSVNFQMAFNPQITKTYASGRIDEMHRLVFRSSKFAFFLLFALCLPLLIEMPVILSVWLKQIPEYTVVFLRLMVLTMLIDATANPLMVAAAATGNVKRYQAVIGGILLLIVPASYIVLKCGGAPWSVFLVHLCISCVAYVTRLFIIRPMIGLCIRKYVQKVIVRCLLVAIVSAIIPLWMYVTLSDATTNVLTIILTSVFITITCSFYMGLDTHERLVVLTRLDSLRNRIFKR